MAYYPPVEPVVPDAQRNKAPELILQGLQQGFAAIGQINAQKRASELAIQEMALKDKLAGEEHDLQLQKNLQGFEIAKEHNKLYGDYIKAIGSTKESVDGLRQLKLLEHVGEVQKRLDTEKSITEFNKVTSDKAVALKLDDAKFQAEHPAQWWAGVQEFKRDYGHAVLGDAADRIKTWEAAADQQKVPFYHGVTMNPDGTPVTDKNAKPIMTPMFQLMDLYKKDPAYVTNGLTAAGMTSVVEDLQKTERSKLNPLRYIDGKMSETRTKKTVVNPSIQRQLDEAAATDFTKGKDEVPSVLRHKIDKNIDYNADGSAPAGALPDQSQTDQAMPGQPYSDSIPVEPPSLPDTSSLGTTKTDIILQHARNAVTANPGAKQEIMRRLAANGIDPRKLDEFNVGAMAA